MNKTSYLGRIWIARPHPFEDGPRARRVSIGDGQGHTLARDLSPEDGARVVAVLNACRQIADPEIVVPQLIEGLQIVECMAAGMVAGTDTRCPRDIFGRLLRVARAVLRECS